MSDRELRHRKTHLLIVLGTVAVGWTRRHYRPRAVETPAQRRWINWFARHTPGAAAQYS